MQTTPRPGLGHRGVNVPYVFWPSTYVSQEICNLAASPDGAVLATACSSGQVYIWHCIADARGDAVRLDPVALAVGGWQGPAEVLGLDFGHVDRAAEVAGLASGLLLVCLLAGGRLRLLDPADGRCVATVPPRACAKPRAVALQVLEDGRHAALAGGGCDPAVVDLWSGRQVVRLAAPGDGRLLCLAAPRFCAGFAANGNSKEPGAVSRLAGTNAQTLLVWHWSRVGNDSGGRSTSRPTVSFTYDFARRGTSETARRSPVALAFQGTFLALALFEQLLVWYCGASSAAPELCLEWRAAGGSGPSAGLAGAQLLLAVGGSEAPSTAQRRPLHGSGARPRSRSAAPPLRSRPAREAPEEAACTLIAWTTNGHVYHGSLDSNAAMSGSCNVHLKPWGALPLTSSGCRVCWWSCCGLTVGAACGRSGDVLRIRATPQHADPSCWVRAVDLSCIWQPFGERQHSRNCSTVSCAVVLEARNCAWLVLGLAQARSRESVCAIVAGGAAPSARCLPLPQHFATPTCLAALSPRFLAGADSSGLVCWWVLPELSLAGQVRPPYRAPVISLSRIWSERSTDNVSTPEPSLVAALDELGKCRIMDLAAGEILCVLQSQSGYSLWVDEPVRLTYDPAGRYIFAVTPTRSWAWDSASGSFEGSFAITADATSDALEGGAPRTQPLPPARRDGSSPVASIRCSSHSCTGLSIDSVVWHAPCPRPTAEASAVHPSPAVSMPAGQSPAWWLGDVLLDGPLWKLPVLLVSPANLFARPSTSEPNRCQELDEARGTLAVPCLGVRDGTLLLETSCSSMPWPVGDSLDDLVAQIASVGVRLRDPPFVVGTMGVDDSLSFPLPRRRGPALRSLPPIRQRRRLQEQEAASVSSTSRELLLSLSAHRHAGKSPTGASASIPLVQDIVSAHNIHTKPPLLSREDCGASAIIPMFGPQEWHPQVVIVFVVRLLLHTEAPQQVLQWCAVPAIRCIFGSAAMLPSSFPLSTWVSILQAEPKGETVADTALRQGAFGSAAGLRDAATVLLALIAYVQPHLFETYCPQPIAALVAECLFVRMLSKSGGVQLQSLCCEVFAMAFPFWRRHLMLAMSKHPLPGSGRGSSAVSSARAVAGRAGCPDSPTERPPVGGDETAGDEVLEWLAVHVLAMYQDSRVAPSCLGVLMQVGAVEPSALLQVMGKAARRLDLGVAYASSALFVLIAFIQRFAVKVLPLLSKFTEVVLRCLEPSDPSLRRQSLLAVTSALHELVQTFPMVAFHQQSQKFAVGTGDGLVVIYDLRTATKWRILEGHTSAVAALAFSLDGSQLGSYSAHDCSIRLWQCSPTGFLGGILGTSGRCLKHHGLPPLSPGTARPRQGRGVTTEGAITVSSWRAVSLAWAEHGGLSLVRENGEALQIPLT